MTSFNHLPVLPDEVLTYLAPRVGETAVDCTVGFAGHSALIAEILGDRGTLIGFDRDKDALAAAAQKLADAPCRIILRQTVFSRIGEVLKECGVEKVDRILLDIGVSSMQLDCAERGFSFSRNAPLDMRMDADAALTAREIVNSWSESELAEIFYRYGEERAARRIAKRIAEIRARMPINTTVELADLIVEILPRRGKIHPATRVFQALRIAVNDELGELERALPLAFSALNDGGRMAVISFHSLEDRMVKHFFRGLEEQRIATLPHRKAIVASDAEIEKNRRSRSAKLRVIEKTSTPIGASKNKYRQSERAIKN